MSQSDDGTGQGSRATEHAPKAIVVFSDGTGNSAAKLLRTNVWRLYEALDRTEPTREAGAQGARRQIAIYDDGVGTSAFRPLALLGGAFGWGLKRNVLDLYTFLCRNYEEGDRIYAFGFSRGAFTIRILIGLLVREGLLQCAPHCTEQELARHAPDAYRAFRRNFQQTGPHVTLLRNLRDGAITAWRRLWRQKTYAEIGKTVPEGIAFVGVWDTVAAYGMPLDELTRGIDKWVWPLSMPNYKLSEKVEKARHALALDDERDTFHPLLWNEVEEQTLIEAGRVEADRLRQVWFAGMHSDVGGGYADDGLAYVALDWMMQEAAAAGLRFEPHRAVEIRRACDPLGPLHDSRRGVGGYYRYQPRKISARLDPPDPTSLIMRNPDLNGRGLLTSVKVHESVLERISSGPDHYTPIVLPRDYQVVRRDGSIVPSRDYQVVRGDGSIVASPETPAAAHVRVIGQEGVWNEVWKKRITYFLTVGVSLVLAGLPVIHWIWPPAACAGPQCLISPVIAGIGNFLPGFLDAWPTAFARSPGLFLGAVVAIAALLAMSASRQRTIHDRMRQLWEGSLGLSTTAPAAPREPGGWIYRLRTNRAYLWAFGFLKWRLGPTVFGAGTLAAVVVLMVALPWLAVSWDMRADTSAIDTAEFEAARSGEVALFVNDAVVSWRGLTNWFYDNNRGAAAEVRIEPARDAAQEAAALPPAN